MTPASTSTFCPNCEADREFRREERDEEYSVRGERIAIRLALQICVDCGESLVEDERDPLEQVYVEYRRRKGLLSPEEIKSIRKQYGLSQRSFAKLLGMSQATINRYEGGGLQDEAHDAAIRLCARPDSMKELVQRRGKFLGERDRRRVEKALAGPSDSPREKLAGLYRRLRDSGLSPKFVKTKVLPEWWDDEYVDSPSILQQAITFISEGLGIDVDSLAGGSVPVVPTPRPCKLKTRRGVSEDDLRWSKCIAIRAATLACQAIPVPSKALPQSAFAVRNGVLMESQIDCVNLDNLLDFCWSRAIPILHLPQLPGKKMDALCGYVDQRPVIVLCNNRRHSAWLLFDLAHELGHIICGHIDTDAILVDERVEHDSDDEEEKQANAFAVELLTGNPNTLYRPTGPLLSAPHLAAAARQAAAQDKVDPGIVAMNYAWGQQFFAVGNAALNELEPNANAPELIRQKMRDYLEWDQLPEESAHFFRRITQAA